MPPWQENLSFSDRLAAIVRMHGNGNSTAEYKTSHPGATAAEASQHSKILESAIFGRATETLDYHHQCNRLVDEFKKDLQVYDEMTTSEDVQEGEGKGSRSIGRYQNAVHFRDGLFSDVYKTVAPQENQEGFLGKPGSTVALKVTYLIGMEPPHDSQREVRILQKMLSPNIIPLLESFREPGHSHLVLVFPFMPYDLDMILQQEYLAKSSRTTYLKDLFSALKYVHAQGLIHRDVKPSNILMKSLSGPVYLADFGIAWSPDDPASEPTNEKITDVGTTSYRAPEILFGKKDYDQSLDMWAAGCVAVQVITSSPEPLFEAGDLGSDLKLIQSIFKKLGTPNTETWPDSASCPDWGKVEWVDYPTQQWSEIIPEVSEAGKDLVSKLVLYESGARLTSEQALGHPYFASG
ncbi:kinase-like protein [Venturia nashicola]|uniref:cyclin-dependent kinase n=1 Tax=Venturia nashicola TaxID=86259 RepID=A0A4Z1PBP9_9PEZI|nr:kinase-like protein [Venturia nashicola]TLD35438.1 kinase-like protein [Venturia nashicola]